MGTEDVHLVSIPNAAQRLGISIDTIRREIRRGGLPARKVFGRWRISLADLAALGQKSTRKAEATTAK